MIFNFLGSFYSCIFNIGQCYLIDFVIAFITAILCFVLGIMVLVFFNGRRVKYFSYRRKFLEL